MELRGQARMRRILQRFYAPAFAFALTLGAEAHAQEWPSRSIQLIVPFPAGGAVDIVARAVADSMSAKLRQPVVVVNRDGASGTIGASAIVAAKPDGYTLGFTTIGPFTVQPHRMKLPYVAEAAQGICQLTASGYVVAVAPQSKITSIEELIAEGRRTDKQLNFGYGGAGTPPHIGLAQLQQLAKTKMLAVSFRGDPQVINAMRANEVDAAILNTGLAAAQNFRLLAFLSERRVSDFPDVPTATERGFPIVLEAVAGIVSPRGLPAPILAKLDEACQTATKAPQVVEIINTAQQELRYAGPAAFEKYIADTSAIMAPIIRDAGIREE